MPKNVYNKGKKRSKAKKAKTVNGKQNQRIKKLENLILPAIERKSRDITAFGASISSGGYANQPLFQLEQGDGHNQRLGDKVTLRSMQVSLTLAAQDSTNSMRIIFLSTPSTTALSLDDVLEYGNYTTDGDMVFSSPYRRKAPTAESTYNIMFDKVYHFKDNMRLLTDKFELDKIPKNGRQCNFNSTGSVMPENFQVQILAVSDSTASPHPAISYVVRSKYIDL
jgi:hypothetical protein